jgi:hypothetical protein
MKENRLLLCIYRMCDLGKINSKYFTFMNYFNRFAIKSTRNLSFAISTFRWCICSWKCFKHQKLNQMIAHPVGNQSKEFSGSKTFPGANAPPKRRNWEWWFLSWFDGEPIKIVHKGEILRIIFTKITNLMDTQ